MRSVIATIRRRSDRCNVSRQTTVLSAKHTRRERRRSKNSIVHATYLCAPLQRREDRFKHTWQLIQYVAASCITCFISTVDNVKVKHNQHSTCAHARESTNCRSTQCSYTKCDHPGYTYRLSTHHGHQAAARSAMESIQHHVNCSHRSLKPFVLASPPLLTSLHMQQTGMHHSIERFDKQDQRVFVIHSKQ